MDAGTLAEKIKSTKTLLRDCQSAQQALLAENRGPKAKASELPFLRQSLSLKKKEIKLTKQKMETLQAKIARYDNTFAKLKGILQSEL